MNQNFSILLFLVAQAIFLFFRSTSATPGDPTSGKSSGQRIILRNTKLKKPPSENPFGKKASSGISDQIVDNDVSGISGRIAGGDLVAEFEAPYQLFIRERNTKEFICGAVLTEVDEMHVVMTAAHCIWRGIPEALSTVDLETIEIVGGVANRTDIHVHLKEQVRIPVKAVVYERYEPGTFEYDVALLFMSPDFLETKAVHPIQFPDVDDDDQVGLFEIPRTVQIFGWGATYTGGNKTDSLLSVTLPTIDYEQCQTAYKLELNRFNFCGDPERKKGGCVGDNGGVAIEPNRAAALRSVVGIMVMGAGIQCGSAFEPTVFIKAKPFHPWVVAEANIFRSDNPPPESSEEYVGPNGENEETPEDNSYDFDPSLYQNE